MKASAKIALLLSTLLLSCALLASCGGNEPTNADTTEETTPESTPYDDREILSSVTLEHYTGLTVELLDKTETKEAALWRTLTGNAEITAYPKEQLRYYESSIRQSYRYLADLRDIPYEELCDALGITEETVAAEARDLVRGDMVRRYVTLHAGIALSDEEISTLFDRYAEKIAEDHGYTVSYAKTNLRELILETMLRDKTTQYLLERNEFVPYTEATAG